MARTPLLTEVQRLAAHFDRRVSRREFIKVTGAAVGAAAVSGPLAAFASAIILAMISVQIAYESVARLAHPVPIAYGEAIAVAVLGLGVNLVSAWLLRDDHSHDHGVHATGHHHHDNNLRAAYVHVRPIHPIETLQRD